ncbi:hypothetical protein chiPu_0030092 [Chiloscyllium punctatum]|uniref:Uncharacterized protein n=1 Tax=Chiloscyllium punctatum TaxID=137246 RepID=A0A401TTQ2_CHIPU|nr:hypothetical protein [Chiloscyllium punctatum]
MSRCVALTRPLLHLQDDQTPLHCAARLGHLKVVRLLLENGACLLSVSTTGHTALHMASREGHVDVTEVLLDQGALLTHMTKVTQWGKGGRARFLSGLPEASLGLRVVQPMPCHGVARGSWVSGSWWAFGPGHVWQSQSGAPSPPSRPRVGGWGGETGIRLPTKREPPRDLKPGFATGRARDGGGESPPST